MRFDESVRFPSAYELKLPELGDYANSLHKSLYNYFNNLINIINGRLSFGDGTYSDNFDGVWLSFTTPVTPDTEFAVQHSLKRVPKFWLVMSQDQGGVLYKSSTSWTDTQVYFKCTQANMNVTIFLM